MKMHRITSLTSLTSFVLLILSGTILYITPKGRVAYWADWHLWGLSKTQWGELHINLGLLFLIASSLHIYYNWKPITAYLKNKARELKIFTPDFNIALVITFTFALGTLFSIPPFTWVLDMNTYFQDSASEKYGEPPYGHAELSTLKSFTKKVGLDLKQSKVLLQKAGIKFSDTDQSIQEIAHLNDISPKQLHLAMKPAASLAQTGSKMTLPDSPPPGFGRRNLADISNEYNLNIPKAIKKLADQDIEASAEMNIRDIAEKNGTDAIKIFEMIKESAQ